jgi:hypothetical protein
MKEGSYSTNEHYQLNSVKFLLYSDNINTILIRIN